MRSQVNSESMRPKFLDTNILLRFMADDDEDRSRRGLALLHRVERGELRLVTSTMVIFETVFVLRRRYRASHASIRRALIPVLTLEGLHVPDRGLLIRALDLCVELNVPLTDAYNVASMEALGIAEIFSWDPHFNRFPNITRLEPDPVL
jgi:predicted nucleic acid-binding protein